MKNTFLFCSKLRVYWCELPLIAILILCIKYNKHSTGLYGLYLLGITASAAMLFVLIYFFRVIALSFDEVRYIGWFSSRDRAIITEGKTIILRPLGKRRIRVSLYGNDGVTPGFDWLKSTQNAPRDYYLFRGKAIGGKCDIKRILRFYGVSKEEAEIIVNSDGNYKNNFENVTVSTVSVDNVAEIHIRMDKTV